MISKLSGIQLSSLRFLLPSTPPLAASPATYQIACCFIAEESELNYFWIYVHSVSGTDAYRQVTFELQSDSSGVPSGTVIQSFEKIGGWISASSNKIEPSWTGSAMTIGTKYWIVLKNTASVPTTNYITIGHRIPEMLGPYNTVYNTVSEYGVRFYNGTNWTTSAGILSTALTISWPSGRVDGLIAGRATAFDTTYRALTTRAVGAEFTVPTNSAILNISGVSMAFSRTGSPVDIKLNVYINRIFAASITRSFVCNISSAFIYGILTRNVIAKPGETVSILSDATGTGSNYYEVNSMGFTNHPDFLSRKSFKGTAAKIKLESGTWTREELSEPDFTIFLDSEIPFLPVPLNRRKFNSTR